MRAFGCRERRREPRFRMRVGEMHADGDGLVEHQIAVHQHRDLAVRVELQVLGRLVGGIGAVDELQLERHAELFEQDVHCQAGVAGEVMEWIMVSFHACFTETGIVVVQRQSATLLHHFRDNSGAQESPRRRDSSKAQAWRRSSRCLP